MWLLMPIPIVSLSHVLLQLNDIWIQFFLQFFVPTQAVFPSQTFELKQKVMEFLRMDILDAVKVSQLLKNNLILIRFSINAIFIVFFVNCMHIWGPRQIWTHFLDCFRQWFEFQFDYSIWIPQLRFQCFIKDLALVNFGLCFLHFEIALSGILGAEIVWNATQHLYLSDGLQLSFYCYLGVSDVAHQVVDPVLLRHHYFAFSPTEELILQMLFQFFLTFKSASFLLWVLLGLLLSTVEFVLNFLWLLDLRGLASRGLLDAGGR